VINQTRRLLRRSSRVSFGRRTASVPSHPSFANFPPSSRLITCPRKSTTRTRFWDMMVLAPSCGVQRCSGSSCHSEQSCHVFFLGQTWLPQSANGGGGRTHRISLATGLIISFRFTAQVRTYCRTAVRHTRSLNPRIMETYRALRGRGLQPASAPLNTPEPSDELHR